MKIRNNKTKISSEAILSTAVHFFSKKGYKGTSIKDISDKLKVSKPAIYYYFNNKMEILEILHSRAFEELLSPYEEVTNCNLPLVEKFKKLIENQVKVVAKNADLVKIFFGDYKEFPKKIKREIRKKRRRYTENWTQLYEAGIKADVFRDTDPKISVFTFMGACNWIQMWYSPNGKLNENELAKLVTDLLATGYLTHTSLK